MKKIINGKKYDTETAKCVGGWDNKRSCNDFDYCSEELYQKRTGEFFLHGEGGARSKYAESRGNNNWGSGSQIIPLSYEAAREWAEEHLSTNEYEEIFGEVTEDESRAQLTVSITAALLEQAKRSAAKRGVNVSAYISGLIQDNS